MTFAGEGWWEFEPVGSNICNNWRGIYDSPLALNSNLTSVFNRSWDIRPSLYTVYSLSLKGN